MRSGFKILQGCSKLLLRSVAAAGFSLANYHLCNKQTDMRQNLTKEQEKALEKELAEAELMEKIVKEQNISNLNKIYFGNAADFKEGKIYPQEVLIKERKVKLLLIKYQGSFHCLSATCTYDGKTDLGKGMLFGDKLVAPENGSAYNVQSGMVEYGPAIDNLPLFQAKVDKDGRVFAFIPDHPPTRIRPLLATRDFNDLRRVVIVGSDPAVISCAETLRQFDYTGDLIVVSDSPELPIDKTLLRKSIKYLDYETLELRDSNYLRDFDLNYIFDNPVSTVNKERGQHQVTLYDGTNIDFDALVVATGASKKPRHIDNDTDKTNISYLENRVDHVNLRYRLKNVKKLTVMGLNMESLELVSTLRREYPKVHITVIDDNSESVIHTRYGEKVAKNLIQLQKNRGVDFVLGRRVLSYQGDRAVEKIYLRGKTVETDHILYFPNNLASNTEFFRKSNYSADISFDTHGRLKVGEHMASDVKRIFAAGESASASFFANNDPIDSITHNMSVNQGVFAAYNVLGLGIPYMVVPYNDYDFYGHKFREAGHMCYFEKDIILGDLNDFNYTAFYSNKRSGVLMASGFQKDGEDMNIIREAIRLNLHIEPDPDAPTIFNDVQIYNILKKIKTVKKSGCYKPLIFEQRYTPLDKMILWTDSRMRMGDAYYNFWEHGRLTPAEAMRRQDTEEAKTIDRKVDRIKEAFQKQQQSPGK